MAKRGSRSQQPVSTKSRQGKPWLRDSLALVITFLVNICSAYVTPVLGPYWKWVWPALIMLVILDLVWPRKKESGEDTSTSAINNSNVITADTAHDVTQVIGGEGQVFVGSPISGQVARNIYNIAQNRPTPAPSPGSAPPVPSIFIGRDDAIRELKKRLGVGKGEKPSGVTQVLTAVHGWPGVGKTSVAAALAHDKEVREALPDGVLWASLDTSSNIMTELAKWGRALGIDNLEQANDAVEASATLAGLLNDKRMLLLVDDAWDAAHIQPFRVGGTGCAMLVTTLKPDTARAIAPDENARYNLDVLTVEDAIELLKRLARKVVARYPEESRALVNELGRLPLAIQVAGRLLAAEAGGGLGVTELLKDIGKGAALLKANAPADMADLVHETTPTVLALLMKSVDCLDKKTRKHFPYLAPFVPKPSSFGLPALAAAWGVENPKATVRALVDFGLIEPAETEGRYHTHAIITRLADHLAQDDTEPWLKHAVYYALLADAANDTYLKGGEGALKGLAVFDAERQNIEAGRQWAVENADADDSAAQLCVDYALDCPHLLSLRLHPRKQILWLESARHCARHLKHRRNEGAALGNLGLAYASLGDYRRAIEFHEQALEITREIGDRRGEASALGNLGSAYFSLGKHPRAVEYHEQALKIDREIGDRRGQETALGNLGVTYLSSGEYRRAIEFWEQALEIARKVGDRHGEGQHLDNLGGACFSLGEYRRAIEFHEQRLKIAREIGDRRGEGHALGNLGSAYGSLGDYRRAIEFHEQRLEIAHDIGDRQGEGIALFNLGVALDKVGGRDRAIELAGQALVIFEEIGSPGAQNARNMLAEWQEKSP